MPESDQNHKPDFIRTASQDEVNMFHTKRLVRFTAMSRFLVLSPQRRMQVQKAGFASYEDLVGLGQKDLAESIIKNRNHAGSLLEIFQKGKTGG